MLLVIIVENKENRRGSKITTHPPIHPPIIIKQNQNFKKADNKAHFETSVFFFPVTPILPVTHVFSIFATGTFDVSRAVFRKLPRASEKFSRAFFPKMSRGPFKISRAFREKVVTGIVKFVTGTLVLW